MTSSGSIPIDSRSNPLTPDPDLGRVAIRSGSENIALKTKRIASGPEWDLGKLISKAWGGD